MPKPNTQIIYRTIECNNKTPYDRFKQCREHKRLNAAHQIIKLKYIWFQKYNPFMTQPHYIWKFKSFIVSSTTLALKNTIETNFQKFNMR